MEDSTIVVDELEDDSEGFEGQEAIEAYLELKKNNHERFMALAKQGVRLQPHQIIQIQFDVLLGILGPEATAAWASAFEHRMQTVLGAIEADLPRQKLLAGTQTGELPPDIAKLAL